MRDDLLSALGWLGGTTHQALAEVRRVRADVEALRARVAPVVEAARAFAQHAEWCGVNSRYTPRERCDCGAGRLCAALAAYDAAETKKEPTR